MEFFVMSKIEHLLQLLNVWVLALCVVLPFESAFLGQPISIKLRSPRITVIQWNEKFQKRRRARKTLERWLLIVTCTHYSYGRSQVYSSKSLYISCTYYKYSQLRNIRFKENNYFKYNNKLCRWSKTLPLFAFVTFQWK